MSKGYCRVTLVGNLGADPEVRNSAAGNAVANLRVACTDRAKGKDGQWEDRTEWVSVVCFGKTAENAGQFLAKGRQVFVEGRLQTREWTDKEGNKRYATEVVANEVLFLGGKEGWKDAAKPAAESSAKATSNPALKDDDIPF